MPRTRGPAPKKKAVPQRPPRRRTQEERSAATREKVIQAAIDCIVEEGLHNTTAARLVERSGVTWGAIAHQFGDKDSVLFAVVEHNAAMYRRFLDDALRRAQSTIENRVATLLDVTWKHINEPWAFAFNELVVHNRASPDTKIAALTEQLSTHWVKLVWDEYFGEFGIPPAKLDTSRNLALATLQGLSMMRLVTRQRPRFRNEIAALKRVVTQMLTV